uniref:HIT-type domain-containing protein n=1 Tax=Peronospora matthiolae TaxID=2874970 RepID=A0AAV1TQW3_9STRA
MVNVNDSDQGARSDAAEPLPLPLLDTDETSACVQCYKTDVKYRCPRCERLTCSLQCCVGHKKQFDCNGKRDRTKFVRLQEFTDADLSSDFFFLEEVARSANCAARSHSPLNATVRRYGSNKKQKSARMKQRGRQLSHLVNPDVPADWLTRFPVAVQLFAKHAAGNGVALTILAPGMSKRMRNSSYVDTKNKTVFWRVEWLFPSAEVPVSHFEKRADEKMTLYALIEKYLAPTQENVAVCGKLKKYAVPDWEKHVLLLLRKEFTPASCPQYYRLNGNESLGSNLKRKAVAEFPVITVALVANADKYPVAHDIIEAIDSIEKDERPHATEIKAVEAESRDVRHKTGLELLTVDDTGSLVNHFATSEKDDRQAKATVQSEKLLIEEVRVSAH